MTRRALERLPERGPVAASATSHAAPRLVALREPPAREGGSSLSPEKVIPLVQPRHSAQSAPTIALDPSLRIAPVSLPSSRWAPFLALSLAAHAVLYVPFHRAPQPLASIGIEILSVEIVLGAKEDAGEKPERGTATLSAPPPATPASPPTEIAAAPLDQARDVVVVPSERAAETAAAAPVATPELMRLPAQTDAVTIETPSPDTVQVAIAQPSPAQTIDPPAERLAAAIQRSTREHRRNIARAPTRNAIRPAARETAVSTGRASRAAGGVGHGRSDSDTNYRGLVAAHLTRHKRFPPEALSRGERGRAVVSFSLDGAGRVTSTRLVSGTGVPSLDGEAVTMVRRASPFPAPPDARPISFTVPINFQLR